MTTVVEEYWTEHTVHSAPFTSATESLDYLQWRSNQYPFFQQLTGIWGDHQDEVVLDYGCGPGNDLVGFLVYSGAREVIGMDVSTTSIELSRGRIALHDIDPRRFRLVKVDELPVHIPLRDGSVDYISCQGVLHHVSDPDAVLREFHRVLRPGGTATIMVYNRESVFFHLIIAYIQQVAGGIHAEMSTEEAFSRSTDGVDCPISIPYRPDDFKRICEQAGFTTDYLGGYFCLDELNAWRDIRGFASSSNRLSQEHREFIDNLWQEGGYPTNQGLYVGVGGVYQLTK